MKDALQQERCAQHFECSDTSQFAGRTATCLRHNRHALAALSVGKKACTAAYVHTGGSRRRELEGSPDGHSQFYVTMSACHPSQGVYTGVAASAIDDKTVHFILNGAKRSGWLIKVALELYWHDKHYLIIDKISMVSRDMFSMVSNIIGQSRTRQLFSSEEPLVRLNVILVSDVHQFPLVASGGSSPLYILCNLAEDAAFIMVGCKFCKQ